MHHQHGPSVSCPLAGPITHVILRQQSPSSRDGKLARYGAVMMHHRLVTDLYAGAAPGQGEMSNVWRALTPARSLLLDCGPLRCHASQILKSTSTALMHPQERSAYRYRDARIFIWLRSQSPPSDSKPHTFLPRKNPSSWICLNIKYPCIGNKDSEMKYICHQSFIFLKN